MWKGILSFGLVNVPVKLTAAARSESISFNQIHEVCGGRINQKIHCSTCDKTVERSELVKGFEYEKGKFVTFHGEEIEAVAPDSSKVLEITRTIQADYIDPILFESSYYLAPDNGGHDGYALLYRALSESDKYAIGQITLTSREHTVVIRAYQNCLLMHTLFLQDEVRESPNAHINEVKPEYLSVAKQLIEAIEVPDFVHSEFVDHFRQNIQTMIGAKISGQAVPKPTAKAIAPASPDIMDALLASIKAKTGKAPQPFPPKKQVTKAPEKKSKKVLA